LREALHYQKDEGNRVTCLLCPHRCSLKDGARGFCRARKNEGGRLFSLNYARCTSYALDPTEKKPLYHFYPGSYLLSLGTTGCNLKCGFCQNWTISQSDAETVRITPEDAVEMARAGRRRGVPCVGIAYTYSEPLVWYEYVMDVSRLARAEGLVNVLVTNGYICEEPLRELLPYIDAMNVDVKSMDESFYAKVCKGDPGPVRRTVEIARERGCHVEITNLIIPGYNDSDEIIERLVDWVASIDARMPVHFSRYFPQHRFSDPPTPVETLSRARRIARRRLDYVYIGNVWGVDGADTECPGCGRTVIERAGFSVRAHGLEGNRCADCGTEIQITGRMVGVDGRGDEG